MTQRGDSGHFEREHLVYVDQNGGPDECTEDCPGCHWEGNADCEAALARADHGITS